MYTFSSYLSPLTEFICSQLVNSLENFLPYVAPSDDLVPLFRAINPDFIIYRDTQGGHDDPGSKVAALLSWLQVSISLQPDHHFHLVL